MPKNNNIISDTIDTMYQAWGDEVTFSTPKQSNLEKLLSQYGKQYESKNKFKYAHLEKVNPQRHKELANHYEKQKTKWVDKQVSNKLLSEKPKEGRKFQDRLNWYNKFSPEEQEYLSDKKGFQPAKRAFDLHQSDEAKKYGLLETLTTPDKLAQAVQGTPERLRLFRNAQNNVEDFVNPALWLGELSGLGNVPKNIQDGNYGQAALNVAAPLVAGALSSIGAKSTGQFLNNLTNPLAGTIPENLKNYSKDLYNVSKLEGKFTLPTYETLWRWQPDRIPQNLTNKRNQAKLTEEQKNLTGSWYLRENILPEHPLYNDYGIKGGSNIGHSLWDLSWYMQTRPGSGTIKTLKLPKYKIDEIQRNMPASAKGMSNKIKTVATDNTHHPLEVTLDKHIRSKKGKDIRLDINPHTYMDDRFDVHKLLIDFYRKRNLEYKIGDKRIKIGKYLPTMENGGTILKGTESNQEYKYGGELKTNVLEKFRNKSSNSLNYNQKRYRGLIKDNYEYNSYQTVRNIKNIKGYIKLANNVNKNK